jgi:crotonobetainyl-CoA:carnitine CoA-transferase CaiB-like acyl-CoA transferase
VKLEKPPRNPRISPLLWHYTKEILLELGYSEEEIEQLSAMKVTKT